jgi:hypothetical protein
MECLPFEEKVNKVACILYYQQILTLEITKMHVIYLKCFFLQFFMKQPFFITTKNII